MSTNAGQPSQLLKLTGKRKRTDDSALSPPAKTAGTHRQHSGAKQGEKGHHSSSHKKRGNKSGGGGDAFMEDEAEEEPEENNEQGDSDDDESGEDDQEDFQEMEGFIVADHEVEEEEGEDGSAQEGKGEKRHKKKRKRAIRKLSDEDLDLIAENTGLNPKRHKRLQKVSEREGRLGDEAGIKDEEDSKEYQEEVEEDQKLFLPQKAKARKPDQEGDQVIDTRRRLIAPASRRAVADMADEERANKIFENPSALNERIRSNRHQGREKSQDEMGSNLEAMYDADELDDQFATKADREIQSRDIPERLQLKVADRLFENLTVDKVEHFTADIQYEADYIYRRLLTLHPYRNELSHNEDDIREKVKKILFFFRKDNLDVPFIAHYRKYEYGKNLTEEDVWTIFNLDQEYGRFTAQYSQTNGHFERTLKALTSQNTPNLDEDIQKLNFYWTEFQKTVQNLDDLKLFLPLTQFLKQYYDQEILELEETEHKSHKQLPSIKSPYDHVKFLRAKGIPNMTNMIFMSPQQYLENIITNSCDFPPGLEQAEDSLDKLRKLKEQNQESYNNVTQSMRKYLATLYSVQPQLRKKIKKQIYENGYLSCSPTEEGEKVLDIFHPSFRVKHINQLKLSQLSFNLDSDNGDIFLDIVQNENKKLINSIIKLDENEHGFLVGQLWNLLIPLGNKEDYREMGSQIVKSMLDDVLLPELIREVRCELIESAENYVIKYCQNKYQAMLMTGPFSRNDHSQIGMNDIMDDPFGSNSRGVTAGQSRGARKDVSMEDDIIPDRPRCSVMGVILNQLDQVTSIVTVAVIDKYGEVRAHQNLQKLIPPRKFKPRTQGPPPTEEEQLRSRKAQMSYNDEVIEHEKDKDKIKDLIKKFDIDLIVVGANSLESRLLKSTLSDIAENLKNYGSSNAEEDRGNDQSNIREAFVIWGRMEIPKLFSNSYLCQKLLKGVSDPYLKQAVSLARWEQDPLNETLNLWSFVSQENQVLQLSLHPMQRSVNQAKLADSLEEISIKCVNQVGIELNLVVDHEHMHIMLSFASGLGPRKAKQFINSLKQRGQKICIRSDIFIDKLLQKECHFSLIAFLKIKVSQDELKAGQFCDILDQTRIHPESYTLALKIASDIEFQKGVIDKYEKIMAVKAVIKKPSKIKNLDLDAYRKELESTHQQNMIELIELIIDQFTSPFKDPRIYRTTKTAMIPPGDLIYMLTDETPRTLRAGIIVTATVVRVADSQGDKKGFALCKLDSGLDARIDKDDLDAHAQKPIEELVSVGHVVTGRIKEIRDKEETKLGVTLNCKRRDLETHRDFQNILVPGVHVEPSDLINPAFRVDNKAMSNARYQPRRINHPKFKNINSTKAVQLLQEQEVGEFIFRPSSRGPDNITLSWKFFKDNIVHIDITEHDKAPGATIGSKLQISREDFFENLQEIVERYIMPCNKFMREASGNVKFKEFESAEELEAHLKQEKAADPNRIPYKMTVLPQYPQHIVIGYIPKNFLVKEYIKVKPKGYWFHETNHKQIQGLVNWFKENFRQKEYLKFMKRQRSPRAKVPEQSQRESQQAEQQAQGSNDAWGSIVGDWEAGRINRTGSVHSQNNDGDQPMGENRPAPSFSGMGGSSFGRGFRGSRPSGPGMGRGGDAPGGGRGACFNCGEQGHMSRDCPTKSERRSFGAPGRGRGRDDDNPRGSQRRDNQGGDGNNWGQSNANAVDSNWSAAQPAAVSNSPSYGDANVWGNQATTQGPASATWGVPDQQIQPVVSTAGWGQSAQQDQPMTDSWGNAAPVIQQPAAGGWGANPPADNNWGNNNPGFGDSEPAEDGRGSRGRGFRGGRGRGGFDGGSQPSGSRACFKCQQEGHMARECPNAQVDQGRGRGGPGGGSRACFKCNQEGHMARECPNQESEGSGRGRGRGGFSRGGGASGGACHKCNQEGHFARECPNDQGGYKRQRRDDGGQNNSRGGYGGDEPPASNNDNWAQPSNSNAGDQGWGATSGGATDSNRQQPSQPDAWGASSSNQQPPPADTNAWGNNTNPSSSNNNNNASGW